MPSVYTVTSFPTKPYEGASYFNVNLRTLGTFKDGQWKYYKPFKSSVPADSYDLDNDGIPDEFDTDVSLDVSSGKATFPSSGTELDLTSITTSVESPATTNTTSTDLIKTISGPGTFTMVTEDLPLITGEDPTLITKIITVPPGEEIELTLPPGTILTKCTLIDDDGDGIPDKFDNDMGYTAPGFFDSTEFDPSLYLDPVDGGSKNDTNETYSLISNKDGVILLQDGTFVIFKQGDEIQVPPGSVVFLGTCTDLDGDGIPDNLHTSTGFLGASDPDGLDAVFLTTGGVSVKPNSDLTDCGGGSTNTGSSYTIVAEKDGVIYGQDGEKTFFFKGDTVTVPPDSTIFFGVIQDEEGDGIPDNLVGPAGYISGTYETNSGSTIDAVLMSGCGGGLINTSGKAFKVTMKQDGFYVTTKGVIVYFKKGDFIEIPIGATIFFKEILDSDGDGSPDLIDKNEGFTGGTFTTTGGTSINLDELLSDSDTGSTNESGSSYTKIAEEDGVLTYKNGDFLLFSQGDQIEVPDGSTIFYGTLNDSDGDGIPDNFDTGEEYTSGIFKDTGIDPSTILDPITGSSTNDSGKDLSFVAKGDGVLINDKGELSFFKKGDVVKLETGFSVFFGDFDDTNDNSIPDDPFESDAGYNGPGEFNSTGIDPSKFMTLAGGGKTNTGIDYTFQSTRSGMIIKPDGGFILFPKGVDVTVTNGDTLFEGALNDDDEDGITNNLEDSIGYISGSKFRGANVSSVIGGIDDGSLIKSTNPFSLICSKDGLIVDGDGAVTLFKSGDTITLSNDDAVFFGDLNDVNNDGLPDDTTQTINHTNGVFETSGGVELDLSNIISEPFTLSENLSEFPIKIKIDSPVLVINPDTGEFDFVKTNEEITLPPGFIICRPENVSSEFSFNFFDKSGSSLILQEEKIKNKSFSVQFFEKTSDDTMQMKDSPFISTSDFTTFFEEDDNFDEDININDEI